MRKLLSLVITTSSVVFLDYLTKRLVNTHIDQSEAIPLLSFLRIVHVQNKGAAFGLFSDIGNSIFIIISFIAIILVVVYLLNIKGGIETFSLSLILGGAIGNLIDRLLRGGVIDFIDFYIGKWHWPAFNVADSSLTIGMVLFLLANLKHKRHKRGEESH